MSKATFLTDNPRVVGSTAEAIISLTISPGISFNLPSLPNGNYPETLSRGLQEHSKMMARVICAELGIDPNARAVLRDSN